MQTYDILMLLVLVGATLFGFWKGLAWQVASIASIFLSYVLAVRFRGPVAAAIDAEPPWNMFLAMLILYIAASLAIWVVFGFIRRFISQMQLKEFDRQIGGLLGFGKGVLLCVIITLFAVTLLGDARRETIVNSTSGYYIAVLLDRSHSLMPPEVHEVLHPYIVNLNANHGSGVVNKPPPAPVQNGAPSNDAIFGGPLFGGGQAPTWPGTTNTSNGGQGGWPTNTSSSQPPLGSQPMQPVQQWTRDQWQNGQQIIRDGQQQVQEAVRDQIQNTGQQFQEQFRNQVNQQLDKYLPPR